MSFHAHQHLAVPFGSSLTEGSVDERVRPNLQRAYPLPQDDDPRFQQLLEALKQAQLRNPSAGHLSGH